MRTDKNKIDVAQAFLTYTALVGDADKTAAALDLEPSQIRALAESEGWNEKLRRISFLSKSGRPGDFERGVNRAMNFVAVQCLRQQLDRMLSEIRNYTNEELMDRACVRTRDGGQQISAKIFTDLSAAMEACHRMSYAALSDTVTERAERDGGSSGSEKSSDSMHAAIIAHLSNPSADPGPITQRLMAEANDKAAEIASGKLRTDDTAKTEEDHQ